MVFTGPRAYYYALIVVFREFCCAGGCLRLEKRVLGTSEQSLERRASMTQCNSKLEQGGVGLAEDFVERARKDCRTVTAGTDGSRRCRGR